MKRVRPNEGAPDDRSGVGSREEFERFYHLVMADSQLQVELRSIPDWPAFVAAALVAAARHGLELTEEAVTAARKESLRTWRGRWV
jgi:hypothetical protein